MPKKSLGKLALSDEKSVESASPATESIAVAGKPDAEQPIIHDISAICLIEKIAADQVGQRRPYRGMRLESVPGQEIP